MSYLELIALDEAIAVEIMGWRRDEHRWLDADGAFKACNIDYIHIPAGDSEDRIFRPTLHAKFAFQVVAKLAEIGLRLRLIDDSTSELLSWAARFYRHPVNVSRVGKYAETPELAICRAAIAAIRREKGERE